MSDIAIIGGTGVESWPGATIIETVDARTSYGPVSAPLHRMEIADRECWFLSRHGGGHDIAPHLINYRANIAALFDRGVRRIIALNAVGVIGDCCPPGQLALPDQLIDYTWGRESTFFDGREADLRHIDFTDPYCPELREHLADAAGMKGLPLTSGGVYGATQGPRLETRAEVDRLERDGVHFIGMTGAPEAALAREKDIQYACVALVVNAAAGRASEDIHAALASNMADARDAAAALVMAYLGFFGKK